MNWLIMLETVIRTIDSTVVSCRILYVPVTIQMMESWEIIPRIDNFKKSYLRDPWATPSIEFPSESVGSYYKCICVEWIMCKVLRNFLRNPDCSIWYDIFCRWLQFIILQHDNQIQVSPITFFEYLIIETRIRALAIFIS
jgi:hypothetical protein